MIETILYMAFGMVQFFQLPTCNPFCCAEQDCCQPSGSNDACCTIRFCLARNKRAEVTYILLSMFAKGLLGIILFSFVIFQTKD